MRLVTFVFASLAVSASALCAQSTEPLSPMTPNIPKSFTAPREGYNYTKRVEMVPMRDGVKLYTVIVVPQGAKNAPMVLTRTPYNAAGRASAGDTPELINAMPLGDDQFVGAGYIRVYQDVRGKYGSEGDYVMTPPPTGPLNPNLPNDTMDAWDTIDWLVKNVPESNGRVGMIGSSYEGFTVVMALLNPHPALKVAAPESPMIDGWMGDDWFHYGAFRQFNLDYFTDQTIARGRGQDIVRRNWDEYTNFLEAGSAGDFARMGGLDQLPYWHLVHDHAAYDSFWQGQALDQILKKTTLKVPTIWEQGLWDQEDMWGATHSFAAVEAESANRDKNFIVMGPWFHSQINRKGLTIGALTWNGDTTLQYRRDVILPFFNQYLKDGAPKADTAKALIYNTGLNRWDRYAKWPLSCAEGCDYKSKPLYLEANGKLGFDAPNTGEKFDEYVSDPAKPVPFSPRPYGYDDNTAWQTWLVRDQRFVDGRTDVLTFETAPLTEPLTLAGRPEVHLWASTSGTDSDWVVKLIDVYPGIVSYDRNLSGYELPISMDIFRGRYRTSFEKPEAIKADTPLLYQFGLPMVNHVFLPGHRIMVQVQSSLFPLYDRNPQKFVVNIFDAKAGDYQKATERVWHAPGTASFIELPVVPAK